MANNEFLPLCDVLFNIISLLWYFCNVVFDLVFSYALFNRHKYTWFFASLTLIILSLVINQVISLRCYNKNLEYKLMLEAKYAYFKRFLVIAVHIILCGVLWRYLKLFIPVDIRFVKHEVRDLCILRLTHAFCEAAPMLLLQMYLLLKEIENKEMSDLILVSSMLSLFSMCWALASFSKNVRLQNVHRLVFTWLGVIFQLLWRLGTVGSRVSALTLYATLYGKWLFLVLGLHWMSMFFWLISPKNVFHGEKISRCRKAVFSMLIAFIYIFSYVNLQQANHRQKMLTYYTVMLLENVLLVAVWLAGVWPNFNVLVPALILASFVSGIGFMCLYYRVFHVRRLATTWTDVGTRTSTVTEPGPGKGKDDEQCKHNSGNNCNGRWSDKSTCPDEIPKPLNDLNRLLEQHFTVNYHEKIPGVFNCRFSSPYANTAKRKKKKPTTFIPPPSVIILPGGANAGLGSEVKKDLLMRDCCHNHLEKCVPFWKRPLPRSSQGTSENEGSNSGPRVTVNIQHKLQEKKQKQLAELKVIEEEIKQGKIERTSLKMIESAESSLQPIPRTKRHLESIVLTSPKPLSSSLRGFTYQLLPPPVRWQHSILDAPELLLAPHLLGAGQNWAKRGPRTFSLSDEERSGDDSGGNEPSSVVMKHRKMGSDADSQVSLPRSYTLPREFKYSRREKNHRIREHVVRSTNSSDGDVDSADESVTQNGPVARRKIKQYQHRHVMHETKL